MSLDSKKRAKKIKLLKENRSRTIKSFSNMLNRLDTVQGLSESTVNTTHLVSHKFKITYEYNSVVHSIEIDAPSEEMAKTKFFSRIKNKEGIKILKIHQNIAEDLTSYATSTRGVAPASSSGSLPSGATQSGPTSFLIKFSKQGQQGQQTVIATDENSARSIFLKTLPADQQSLVTINGVSKVGQATESMSEGEGSTLNNAGNSNKMYFQFLVDCAHQGEVSHTKVMFAATSNKEAIEKLANLGAKENAVYYIKQINVIKNNRPYKKYAPKKIFGKFDPMPNIRAGGYKGTNETQMHEDKNYNLKSMGLIDDALKIISQIDNGSDKIAALQKFSEERHCDFEELYQAIIADTGVEYFGQDAPSRNGDGGEMTTDRDAIVHESRNLVKTYKSFFVKVR